MDEGCRGVDAIHEYLAQASPEYARRIVDNLTRRSIQIASFPFSGRIVPEYELHEVRELIEGTYRLIYLIKEDKDEIEVLALIHTTREQLKTLE